MIRRTLRNRRLLAVGLGLLFVTLVLIMLRPPLSRLGTAIYDPLDGRFISWTLSWGAHASITQPLHFFDANIFFPEAGTLAYADPLVPLVPLWIVLRSFASWPVALNLMQIMFSVLNLWAGYALVRWLTGRMTAGIVGAIVFAFNSYAMSQRAHLQLQTMFFIALGLLLLFKLLDRPLGRRALVNAGLLGVVTACMALSSLYYGAIFMVSMFVILVGFFVARRFRVERRLVLNLLLAGLVTVALVAPFAGPYAKLARQEDYRSELQAGYDLNLHDILSPAPGAYMYGWLDRGAGVEHRLFPGVLAVLLSCVAITGLVRRSSRDSVVPRERRLYMYLLLGAGAVCIVLAIGNMVGSVPAPFRLLFEFVPGFRGLRAQSRFAAMTFIAGSALAGAGFGWIWHLLGRRRLYAFAAMAVVVAVLLLEYSVVAPLQPIGDTASELAVYEALSQREHGPVVELPMPTDGGYDPGIVEVTRMVRSTIDWNPRVNGYSGYYPPGYFERARTLNTFSDPRAIQLLRRLGIRYVVLHVSEVESMREVSMEQAQQVLGGLPKGTGVARHGNSYLIDLDVADSGDSAKERE